MITLMNWSQTVLKIEKDLSHTWDFFSPQIEPGLTLSVSLFCREDSGRENKPFTIEVSSRCLSGHYGSCSSVLGWALQVGDHCPMASLLLMNRLSHKTDIKIDNELNREDIPLDALWFIGIAPACTGSNSTSEKITGIGKQCLSFFISVISVKHVGKR